MADYVKLRDPFGRYQWVNPSRWVSGANTRRTAAGFSALYDSLWNREGSYARQFEAAKIALRANESTFNQVAALHHVAISSSEVTTSNPAGLAFTAYLKPGHQARDAVQLPREIHLRRDDGTEDRYAFPVIIEPLPEAPIVFGFSGGDRVVGEPRLRGVCGFAFKENNENYFITNCHVLSEPDRDPAARKCWYFDTPLGACSYGPMLRSSTINEMDAVVVRTEGIDVDVLSIAGQHETIVDWVDLRVGSTEGYFYVAENATVRCQLPSYVGYTADVVVEGGRPLKFSGFWKLTATSGRPRPGHSGAALCMKARGGLIIAGLVFGGVPGGNEVWVYSAGDIWRALFN